MGVVLSCKSPQGGSDAVGSIEGVDWILVEVDGKDISTPAGGRDVYMNLSREGDSHMLKGYAGCNGLGGDYTLEGEMIKFQPITTKMYCELQMDVENMFTKMLSDTDRFQIDGDVLELYSGDRLLGRLKGRR